jgi:hypothetical protein
VSRIAKIDLARYGLDIQLSGGRALGYADLGFALQAPDLLFCFARNAPGPPFLLVLEALELPCIPGGYVLTGAGLVLLADAGQCPGPDGGHDQRLVETRASQDIRRYSRSDQKHDHPVVEAGGWRWPRLAAAARRSRGFWRVRSIIPR